MFSVYSDLKTLTNKHEVFFLLVTSFIVIKMFDNAKKKKKQQPNVMNF